MDSFPSGIVRGNADYSSYQPDSQNRGKLWMILRRYF
jgi:hypothetical protein